ncbi:MAG: His-Xaa-Ser system protein HxsD [Deltaproteobacteria bacterium]|nr:His-Xaa-Ser system protein HxsD [Deltaproteobacteria bacterium]
MISEEESLVVLSKEFFEREAVFAAALRFTDQYYVGIRPYDEESVEVSIKAKEGVGRSDIVSIFCNELIEEQVRRDLHKSFGPLREIIVAQAFSPLDKQVDKSDKQ